MAAVTLHTGKKMPILGLGTWKSKAGAVETAVKVAIDVGYRHIDCAHVYGNEKEVGNALKEKIGTTCTREDLFITSKLWNTKHKAVDVKPALLTTLKNLQLDYLDLYLIHWPIAMQPGDDLFPKHPDGSVKYDYTSYIETWEALEKVVDEGLVRHIGLSNFNSKQVDEVISKARIPPAVNQCECHAYLNQQRLIDHCKKQNVIFEAYSPFGSPDRPWAKPDDPKILDDPAIKAIGAKYGKTAAQVLIRFQIERGVVVIPKSVTPERIKANFEVFDFKISDEDMKTLAGFDRNGRVCVPTIEVNGQVVPRDRGHPDFPFREPY